jgi:hypothetical protein
MHMNVEIGTEAAQVPEKKFKMGFSLQCTGTKRETAMEKVRETDPGALLCAAPMEVGPRELGDHLVSPGNRTIQNAISQCEILMTKSIAEKLLH